MVWGDRRSLRLLLLQAPIVAAFLLVGFANKPYQQEVPVLRHLNKMERDVLRAVDELGEMPKGVAELEKVRRVLLDERFPMVPQGLMTDPRYTYMLLNILAISVFWFGCNNASKEIVKEEAIYGRERAFNLRIPPYLLSKFVVLGAISAVQVLLLMGVIYGVLEGLHALGPDHQVPPAQYRLAYLPQYGVLVLLAVCGAAMGLLLSACVASPDRASALLPYVLIPQIILGGGIIAIRGEPLHSLAVTLSPVYWAYQAIHRGAAGLPGYHPMHMDDEYGVGMACAALAVQTVTLLALTAWFLRRKDVGQG